MKKLIALGVLLLLVAPVAIRQIYPPVPRHLAGGEADPARYHDVRFYNERQNIELAGQLFAPAGTGPFPAAVIIQGSGPSHRGNRWYLTLVNYLQDNGVLVLLPDKRGSDGSGGDWRSASMEDLATDAQAAVEFLRTDPRVDRSRLGVIGMSQGGWVAPIVAARDPSVHFVVDIVGAAVPAREQLLYEENNNLREMGILPGISNLIALASTWHIRNVRQKAFWVANGDFDPLPWWRRVAVPALVLYGGADTNVPSESSANRLATLEKANIRVIVYPGSGHALEDPPGTGNGLFRKDALKVIRDFIGG